MKRLYVATHNAHKIAEIEEILPEFEIVADDPGDVDECAPDFAGNAEIKVRAIASRHRGEWCMADDSGLEVDALGGAPGVRSARYAGEPCDMEANKALLLKNLEGVVDRKADFACAIAAVDPSGKMKTVVGRCFGSISEKPAGEGGFGYDPLFVPDGHTKSFAELSPEEKNAISHRGRALAEARRTIFRAGGGGIMPWLSFFRIVNLPTVPGDVFAGAAAAVAASGAWSAAHVAWAAAASCAAYLFGLADNDIVGAGKDSSVRPIPSGAISLAAARVARAVCWAAAVAAGLAGRLPPAWWVAASALFAAIVIYNRSKLSFAMGACRGLNVLCGAAALAPHASALAWRPSVPAACIAAAALAYTAALTMYSRGEEKDAAKHSFVGILVGGTVYCQLVALVVLALAFPASAPVRTLLVAGAAMLVLLRLVKSALPRVSAS